MEGKKKTFSRLGMHAIIEIQTFFVNEQLELDIEVYLSNTNMGAKLQLFSYNSVLMLENVAEDI